MIVLACLIFTAFMSAGTPVVDTSLTPVTMAWQYIGETIFNLLVLVGLVKGAERIVKEMFAYNKAAGQVPAALPLIPLDPGRSTRHPRRPSA